MSEFINCSICVSDIPKDRIKMAENGKKYINICVSERKEVDSYGNTHTIFMAQTKEEREAKSNKSYIGSGKAYNLNPAPMNAESVDALPPMPETADDLPF